MIFSKCLQIYTIVEDFVLSIADSLSKASKESTGHLTMASIDQLRDN